MLDSLKAFVLALLRVPTEPAVPGGGGTPIVFRASPNFYRYRLVLWVLAQLGALIGLLVGVAALEMASGSVNLRWLVVILRGLEALAWLIFLLQLPFSFAVLHLDFELRWYVLSDRSLRIREGILSLKEKTMTFANIQNIQIRQNPLQRLLGIADVQVRTAGGGGGIGGDPTKSGMGESAHEAAFRGVDNAPTIRSLIAERVRLHRDSGLGDPDEEHEIVDSTSTLLEAGRALAHEAHRLKVALSSVAAGGDALSDALREGRSEP